MIIKRINTAVGVGRSGLSEWTCRQCTSRGQGGLRSTRQIKGYSTNGYAVPKPKRKGRVLLAAAGGALGVTAFTFTDDVKHTFKAVERSGRVVSALALCINE